MEEKTKLRLRALKSSDKIQLAQLANNKKIWNNVRDGFGHPYTEKNGFQKEGISKKAIFKNGKIWDEHNYFIFNGLT